ncbi:MAG: hypothetical protein ACO3JL_00435 [Myxococcota bacterium]
MRRLLSSVMLFSAVAVSLPAAAHRSDHASRAEVSYQASRIGLYERMQRTGVDGEQVYTDALRGRRLLRHTATPRVGSFAYFRDDRRGSALEVAVVTAVYPDGTLELLHQGPDGAPSTFHMNLARRYTHRAHGTVYNDYVSFTGRTQLATDAFIAFSLPPSPRLVASYRHITRRGPHPQRGHRAEPVPLVSYDGPDHIHEGGCHRDDRRVGAPRGDDHHEDEHGGPSRRGKRA